MSDFIEQSKSREIKTSSWTMSLDAGESNEYDELIERAGKVYWEYAPQLDILHSGQQYINPDNEDDVNDWTEAGQQLFSESNVFRRSDNQDRYSMVSAWWGDVDWIYGQQQEVKALRTPHDVSERRIKADKMSRFVLSGLFGDALAEDDKLRALAGRYNLTPLDAAILVGGAALVAKSRPEVGATYLGKVMKDYVHETWTGGDIPHGDFRSSRQLRSIKAITTSLQPDRAHDFMPVVRMDWVAGNHSIELDIIEELLVYSVEGGVSPAELHESIVAKLQRNSRIRSAGSFSDFGSNDGSRNEYSVRYRLERLREDPSERWLGDAIIPGLPELLIVREEGGIRLVGDWLRDDPEAGLTLSNEEIPDYVATLISGGGGRTSSGAMLRVVDALIERKRMLEGIE